MKSFHDALANYQLGPRYDYLGKRQPLPSRLSKRAFELYCGVFFKLYCRLKVGGRDLQHRHNS